MPDSSSSDAPQSRRTIIRDVLIFQAKLWLEGFKDVVLMPLSLGAAAVDLLFRRSGGRGVLYSVMRLGDRFERWVHLYAALDEAEREPPAPGPRSLDDLLNEAADGIEETAPGSSPSSDPRSWREQ
jgi:hypothetical protein